MVSEIIVEGASVDELRRARLVQEHQDELRNQLSDRGRHSLTGLAVVTWALESGAGAGAEVVEWPQLLGARSWMGGGLGHVRAQVGSLGRCGWHARHWATCCESLPRLLAGRAPGS